MVNVVSYYDIPGLNEYEPVFNQTSYTCNVNEDDPVGTIIKQVTATDLDDESTGDG